MVGIAYGSRRVEDVITSNQASDWLLVWTLDADGSIYAMNRPSTIYSSSTGCNGYTYAQIQAYKAGGWSSVMLTSVFKPAVRWVFTKSANPTNLPIFLQTILTGGNPATYMTVNGSYSMTLDTASSSVSNIGSNPYQFMHNNSGAEPGDIPTLGVSGGNVWVTGMLWGQIDAFSNYGGLLNSTTALIGAGGGNTGDRLLVYIR